MFFLSFSRVALDKLSRFYEAYVAFVDWIDDLSVAQLQMPVSGVDSVSSPSGCSIRDPNATISDRGHRLFAQLKNTSLVSHKSDFNFSHVLRLTLLVKCLFFGYIWSSVTSISRNEAPFSATGSIMSTGNFVPRYICSGSLFNYLCTTV